MVWDHVTEALPSQVCCSSPVMMLTARCLLLLKGSRTPSGSGSSCGWPGQDSKQSFALGGADCAAQALSWGWLWAAVKIGQPSEGCDFVLVVLVLKEQPSFAL